MSDEREQLVEQAQQELGVLLRRARSWFAQVAREVHPDVDAAAYVLLTLVHRGEGSTVTELAERLGVGKPTMSRQVSALERLGLLRREPSSDDRRVARLTLTPVGTQRLREVGRRRDERFRARLADWPAQDVADLARLLGRFNAG